jgi:predicted O-methyltransferase YrrM
VVNEASRQNKKYVAIELNKDYIEELKENLKIIQPALI